MRINYKFIIALTILVIIPCTLALTPYKIEVKELPIHATEVGSPESKPSIYKNIIVYRSGSKQISVYDLTNDQTKNIIDSYFAVIKPRVYNNYVLYQQYDRNGATDLMKYNLLTNKSYIIAPVDKYKNFGSSVYPFVITNNKIIVYVDCNSNSYSEDQQHFCKQNVVKSSPYQRGVVIIDLFNDVDYPASIDLVNCGFDDDVKYINKNYLIKPFIPSNPKEPIMCEKCNLFTGEKEYLPDSYCKQDIDTNYGKGFLTDTGMWGINFGNYDTIYYTDKNTNLSLKYTTSGILDGGLDTYDVYDDTIIFFIGDGKGYLGKILYGNLSKICSSYSLKIIKDSTTINTNCKLEGNNNCKCNVYGLNNIFNKSYSTSVTFNIINNDENNIEKNIQSKIEEVKRSVESENIQQFKLIQEQKNEETNKKFLIVSFVLIIIVVFIIIDYNKTRNLLKKRQKINIGFLIWRRHLVELERKRLLKEKKQKEELEKIRLEVEKEAKKAEEFKKSQEAKGLVQYKHKWGTQEEVKKWKEIEYGINKDFMNLTHFEFEEFIAKLFRKMGYEVTLTKKTGDFGIDVIAKDKNDIIAIQVKQFKHGNNVSNVIVQQVLGAMWKVKANKAIIITTSDFTVQAKVQAREAPIELWNLQTLKHIVRKYFIEEAKSKK